VLAREAHENLLSFDRNLGYRETTLVPGEP
jgi:hypothetical protein